MALDETDDDEDRAAIAALWVSAQGRVLDRIDTIDTAIAALGSEERRVGKECELKCRSRWSPYH